MNREEKINNYFIASLTVSLITRKLFHFLVSQQGGLPCPVGGGIITGIHSIIIKSFSFTKEKQQDNSEIFRLNRIPDIPDNSGLANPRGLAIKFQMEDGQSTDIVGHSFDGFPTSNSDQFRELLLAISTCGATAIKPTDLDKFLDTHPLAKTFITTQKNPSGYATISYFGVNSFKFTNIKGITHIIRYQFIPEQGEQLLSQEQMTKEDPEYLQKEIKDYIAKNTIRFKMYAQIAEAGDKTDDPSIAWPASRKRILLGIIDIKNLADNTPTGDKALSFTPNNIPVGIEIADPMLNFRSKAYPISVAERQ